MRSLLAVVSMLAASLAGAAPRQPYTDEAFKAAQAAGHPVLVEIHADWCAECRMQDRIVTRLNEGNAYPALTRLRVDYDTQKDLVRAFGARRQSTLVLFERGKEIGRLVASTREEDIRRLLESARR